MSTFKMNDLPNCGYLPILSVMFVLVLFGLRPIVAEDTASLFDGKTLNGWQTIDADKQWWAVTDNLITGGSLETTVPHNTFLATQESFANFELTLKIRIRGAGGFINSGVQMRSVRVPDSSEMSGYQVDAGDDWWGKLYDESRRNKVIAEAANLGAVNSSIHKDEWNEYRILAEGPRIRSWINGVPAIDYTESDPNIPLDGHIGIQVHGGGKAMVQVKDVTIKRLPATEAAMTWEKLRSAKSPDEPWTAAEERLGFRVPDGFEVELVAEESEGVGKFVAAMFDSAGRLWTMTALEYPVDANENAEASRQLFATGGVDKILVIDKPFGKQVSKPRVFAEGLVMPLGVLPYKDGAFVQYGNDIRFYRDSDGDGRADEHDVVLTGFGTQDSHLFPHQFTRAPGAYILTAQGLFNYSTVRRPDGSPFASGEKEIPFVQCKLSRFTPSGSQFENLTAGPNNIWGLTISREGETWLQEANDIGYPIIPYEPSGYYATGSRDLLQPYQPLMPPPLAPAQMGGTGLSGLALADDRNGWPVPWGVRDAQPDASKTFYVANPITSRIQMIQATFDGTRYVYQKQSDFLTSRDPKFRPVAIEFGPDGCLYVTDWYNKIISHNEVPRNHPERDKIRGRIWRIRHQSQPHPDSVDIKSLAGDDLIQRLGDDNAAVAKFAWQEIVDRGASELAPKLIQIVDSSTLPDDQRLGALWALEGLQPIPVPTLVSLAADENPNIRHEAARIAGVQTMSSDEFISIASPLIDDPSPRVRAAIGDALRRVKHVDNDVVSLMVRLGKASAPGDVWAKYDREFERFLARWAMQENASPVAAFLATDQGASMPLENRLLATLSLSDRDAAVGLARLMPELGRPLSDAEVRVLAAHMSEPSVKLLLTGLLGDAKTRVGTLRSLLALRTSADLQALMPSIASATQILLSSATMSESTTPELLTLALEAAGAFKLKNLDQPIAAMAADANASEDNKLAALRALRELGSSQYETLAKLATSRSEPASVRTAALSALAESPADDAAAAMVGMLSELNFEQRESLIERMATNRAGATALVSAVEADGITAEDLKPAVLQTMIELLPEDATLKEIWQGVSANVHRTLKLSGGADDYVAEPISLAGAFTVETWIRLDAGIDNNDGILGRAGSLDMNFHDSRFRVFFPAQGDVAIASRPMIAGVWTHLAVTRDDRGSFRIYIGGELSSEGVSSSTSTFENLNIGRTSPNAGTSAALTEFRVWDVARTPREIRDNFDCSFSSEDAGQIEHLVRCFSGSNWGQHSGTAIVESTLDAPKLLSSTEAQQQAEMFARYRELAVQPGDATAGKALFEQTCLVCHQQGGTGGKIGPALDGLGLTGTEAILRNLLTPSAAMEGGYRNYRVLTYSGRIVQGLLVSQDESSVIIRQPNTADQRIEKDDIQRAGFTTISIMPEGLLKELSSQHVSDLFTHLHSLKPADSP
ncbi:MAG: DUF1080 domain-containing protein [Pirellulaceae bacterium]|jgi:putative heme-binding domain-containing protein|nr:DUF1080 domain-containing protein [Pirellulaceae bacterium]